MSLTMIAVNLVITIVILMFAITVLKLNPTISMVMATLYMGISCGMGLIKTAAVTTSGFGNMMGNIGLPIGFGVILGQLLSDCGGANVIAKKITSVFPREKALIALTLTAGILSIPVFADVTFVILMPIGIAIARQINKNTAFAVAMISIGAVLTHTFVPPTPGPLSVAALVECDIGIMLGIGLLISTLTVICSYFIVTKLLQGKKYLTEKDMNPNAVLIEKADIDITKAPGFGIAMLPIILPSILILIGTAVSAVVAQPPEWVLFIGDKMVALLVGAIVAYIIAFKYMNRKEVEKSVARALESCGVIMLVTGAGGSLGAVIKATGIGELLQEMLGASSGSVIVTLLLVFFIGFIFRISLGSGTVASITAMTIMAPVIANLPVHPVYAALAALAGGMTFPHVNDSGFWVMTNLGGLKVKGGIKAYSIPIFIASVVAFAWTLILAVVLPLA